MTPNRMGIAQTLAGGSGAQSKEDGMMESPQHEAAEGQVMSEILATVKDIQQKFNALLEAEQKEAAPQGPAPANAPVGQ